MSAPPGLPGSASVDSPLDRALALALANEREAALRWSASAVEHEGSPSALIITARLLADAGRAEAATEAFELALERSIDAGNLPLAVAAIADLRNLGRKIDKYLDEVSETFGRGSNRLTNEAVPPPPLPVDGEFQPLSSFLTGPALVSKATSIIHAVRKRFESANHALPMIAPLPLFSALPPKSLRALIATFEMISVSSGEVVVSEGDEGAEAFIVARGEVEVRKAHIDEEPTILARLGSGALFGEMALISRAPRAATVVAARPSVLLVAKREALETVAEEYPDVGTELAAHCRSRMVANLVRSSRVLNNVHPDDRPALVDSFETRFFEKGERLAAIGDEPIGLHLIASGEVAVIGVEGGDDIVLAKLGVGEVVGEVALVLRRKVSAHVVAVHPTVTLHLPRVDFIALIRQHPAILQSLYLMAIERDEETSSAIANSTMNVAMDDLILV